MIHRSISIMSCEWASACEELSWSMPTTLYLFR